MKKIVLLISITMLLLTCKKDKEINSGNTTQSILLTSYPLTIGNAWKYYTESHVTDSIGGTVSDNYFDDYWKVIADTTIKGIVSSKMWQLDSNYNGTTHLGFTYYANTPDGFYGMANDNFGSSFFLKSSQEINFNLLGMFDNTSIDSVFIPDTALRFMKFPSNLNDIWFSYEYNFPTPDIVKRKWINDTTITTSAGTFACIKLQMFWDKDFNNQPDSASPLITQYFSSKGLVQEEWNIHVIFTSGGWGTVKRISKLIWKNF